LAVIAPVARVAVYVFTVIDMVAAPANYHLRYEVPAADSFSKSIIPAATLSGLIQA
jgi:hypothetical protein